MYVWVSKTWTWMRNLLECKLFATRQFELGNTARLSRGFAPFTPCYLLTLALTR